MLSCTDNGKKWNQNTKSTPLKYEGANKVKTHGKIVFENYVLWREEKENAYDVDGMTTNQMNYQNCLADSNLLCKCTCTYQYK